MSVGRVTLFYVLVTLCLAYPLSVGPAGHVLSASPDTNLFLWTLSWDAHAFVRQPFTLFDANIYYPARLTLAYSENLIGSAMLAAPVLWVTDNPVLAMNVVALLASVLCGLGTYMLARQVGVSAAGATLSGLVFAFSPPRFLRLDQLHLATMQWIPFGLAALHAYFDKGRAPALRLAAACFTLQALSSGHGAVFMTLSLAGLVAFEMSRGAPVALGRRARDLGWAGALLLAPAAIVLVPYQRVQAEVGLRRSLENWAISWPSFLASPSHAHQFILERAGAARLVNEQAGAYLFPGYLPLLLSLAAVSLGWRAADRASRMSSALFYALLTSVSLWLAVGPPVGIWPFVYWMPVLNFIRVPSRFTILTVLGLAVLSGIGFDRLSERFGPARRVWLAVALAVLMVTEFAAVPFEVEPLRVEIPAIDRWLDTQPKPFAIAEVPLADPHRLGAWERRHTTYMLHAMAHWQKTVEGYSGWRPAEHEALYSKLTAFPDEPSVQALKALGVRYVVVHADLYDAGEWPRIEERIARLDAFLKLEHVEGDGRVYSIAGR